MPASRHIYGNLSQPKYKFILYEYAHLSKLVCYICKCIANIHTSIQSTSLLSGLKRPFIMYLCILLIKVKINFADAVKLLV